MCYAVTDRERGYPASMRASDTPPAYGPGPQVKPTQWYGEAALQTTLTREVEPPAEGEEPVEPGPDVREAMALSRGRAGV